MKKLLLLLVAILMQSTFVFCQTNSKEFPVLNGPYFGQKLPVEVPVPFAKEIFGNIFKRSRSMTFLPDGTEAYWGVIINENNDWKRWIVESKLVNGQWTEPKLASFSKYGLEDDVPCLSPDGAKLFFISRRPINQKDSSNKENIWVMDRVDGYWGDPEPLSPTINSLLQIHHKFSFDLDGTLYFSAGGKNGFGELDIYCSKLVDGNYQEPENLGPVINGPLGDYTPFIAADGSYLIFCRNNPDGWSLLISTKQKNNNWGDPEQIARYLKIPEGVNTSCPSVTSDGKYLIFYCSDNESTVPYWVDASVIEELKQKEN